MVCLRIMLYIRLENLLVLVNPDYDERRRDSATLLVKVNDEFVLVRSILQGLLHCSIIHEHRMSNFT